MALSNCYAVNLALLHSHTNQSIPWNVRPVRNKYSIAVIWGFLMHLGHSIMMVLVLLFHQLLCITTCFKWILWTVKVHRCAESEMMIQCFCLKLMIIHMTHYNRSCLLVNWDYDNEDKNFSLLLYGKDCLDVFIEFFTSYHPTFHIEEPL